MGLIDKAKAVTETASQRAAELKEHAAGIGELLAQITLGERPYCRTGFLDPARFA